MSGTPRLTRRFSKPTLSRLINGDIALPEGDLAERSVRLDHYLVEKHPEYNRATLQKYIRDGSVRVNGEVVTKPATRVLSTDEVVLSVSEQNLQEVLPKSIVTSQPAVIYEDENVLMLDKPAGMLSMSKGEYNPEPTIEDYGLLVHRLDRLTSGVIIVAKNPATQALLRKQFQQRKVHKTYYAVVAGIPEPAHAIIDVPIARNLARPSTFQPDAEGREATTEYRVVDGNGKYALVELKPTTGRTHQLRIHMAYIGHPIVGDPVYGGGGDGDDDASASRMFLHATALEITLAGGVRKLFESPLPKEFADVLGRP